MNYEYCSFIGNPRVQIHRKWKLFSFFPLSLETRSQLWRAKSRRAHTSLKLKYCPFAWKTIENLVVIIALLNQNTQISYKICSVILDIVVSGKFGELRGWGKKKRFLQRLGTFGHLHWTWSLEAVEHTQRRVWHQMSWVWILASSPEGSWDHKKIPQYLWVSVSTFSLQG